MRHHFLSKHAAVLFRRYPWITGILYHVWRIFQQKFSVGVVGVTLDDEHHVLLVEHVFHPLHPWGLPGGWVDRNEDPQCAIEREYMEELGIKIDVGPILLMESQNSNHLDIAYLCTSNAEKIDKLSYELLQHRWFNWKNLPDIRDFHRRAIHNALAMQNRNG